MATPNNAKIRSLLARAIVIAGLGLTLAGCGTREPGESIGGRLLVAPGKFINYTCQQLEIRANGVAGRRKQLDQLMTKAGTTPDGRFVSLMAYQAEYTETGADLAELRRAAAAKECKPIASLQTPPAAR
jgi:hypothetical protein